MTQNQRILKFPFHIRRQHTLIFPQRIQLLQRNSSLLHSVSLKHKRRSNTTTKFLTTQHLHNFRTQPDHIQVSTVSREPRYKTLVSDAFSFKPFCYDQSTINSRQLFSSAIVSFACSDRQDR